MLNEYGTALHYLPVFADLNLTKDRFEGPLALWASSPLFRHRGCMRRSQSSGRKIWIGHGVMDELDGDVTQPLFRGVVFFMQLLCVFVGLLTELVFKDFMQILMGFCVSQFRFKRMWRKDSLRLLTWSGRDEQFITFHLIRDSCPFNL